MRESLGVFVIRRVERGLTHGSDDSKAVAGALVTVDLILVEPAFGTVWAGRQTFERDGVRLVVVSREGLVAMKRIAGRAQDVADIEALRRGDGDD